MKQKNNPRIKKEKKANGLPTYGFQVLEKEKNPSQKDKENPTPGKKVRSVADNVKGQLNASSY